MCVKPRGHLTTSLGLGALFWARSRDWRTMVIALGFGVLIDLDHLFDYWYAQRRPQIDLAEFMTSRYWRRSGRLFVLFHAFEYLPFVFLAFQALKGRRWAMAATVAMSSHVLADHLANDLRPLGYFITYRIKHRFRAAEIIDMERATRLERLRAQRRRLAREGRLPLHQRLLSWFV